MPRDEVDNRKVLARQVSKAAQTGKALLPRAGETVAVGASHRLARPHAPLADAKGSRTFKAVIHEMLPGCAGHQLAAGVNIALRHGKPHRKAQRATRDKGKRYSLVRPAKPSRPATSIASLRCEIAVGRAASKLTAALPAVKGKKVTVGSLVNSVTHRVSLSPSGSPRGGIIAREALLHNRP